MLDLMRKHASSWLIKVILGAIIVTFIFFFGYSSFRKGMRGGRMGAQGGIAAKVNGTPISESEFSFFFDRNFEQIKQNFQGKEIPEFARQLVQNSTMQQLISREVALQLADALGIVVTDEELADTIRKAQTAQMGGEFDPIAYRHTFLPSFRNRYGMDYEQFVRQDLRLSALQDVFASIDAAPPGDALARETTWTFEAVAIDPRGLAESKAVGSEDEARALAGKLSASAPKEWPRLLKPAKLEAKKVGPLTIAQRTKLLDGKGSLSQYETLFTLTPEHPVVSAPLDVGGKLAVVRLLERHEKEGGKEEPLPKAGGLFQEWMGRLLAKAKVENYMQKEQQAQP